MSDWQIILTVAGSLAYLAIAVVAVRWISEGSVLNAYDTALVGYFALLWPLLPIWGVLMAVGWVFVRLVRGK